MLISDACDRAPHGTPCRTRVGISIAVRIAFYSPRSELLQRGLAQGGDPVFLHGLFDALRARGHEIEVVSRLNVRDVWRGRVPFRDLVREVIEVRRRMRHYKPDAWLIYNASRTYPDLFGWWQRSQRYVLLAAHWWQSPKVPRRWRWILSFAHRRSIRRADAVTVFRAATRDRLRRRGVVDSRLSILPPSAELVDAVPSQDDARRHLRLPREAAIVFCASRFTDRDDSQGKTQMMLDLLAVIASLPDGVLLVVAGDGPGRSRIEAEIEKLQLAERVRLVGAVDNTQVKWFFAASDLYAYPYPGDIPSVSVLEAQACGRPVVTMRTSSGELTVAEGGTGLLANTLEDFRRHLAALTSDRSRCAEMGARAREFVSYSHSTEVRARQIEELLGG
jgi:glycosyltransferase involved in cell wall biosynthesis